MGRERREHDVFLQLCKGCLGLRERISESSAEEIELVADLVSCVSYQRTVFLKHFRFKKAQTALEQTTPNV